MLSQRDTSSVWNIQPQDILEIDAGSASSSYAGIGRVYSYVAHGETVPYVL